MILGATITGSLILNGVNLSSITGSEASINALNSFTASAATTGSNVFKSNQTVTGSVDITGSLTVVGPITGTVTTASYVLNAVSASYALNATTASYALISTSASFTLNATSASYAANATTASYALVATSASYAANSDLLDGRDSLTFANTGSNSFVGQQNINGSVAITGSLVTTGAITAQTLNVQQVTSSIVYSSGSNIFGNSVSNTQSITGSLQVTGSTHYLLGNVGIGTTSPVSALNVAGTTGINWVGSGNSSYGLATIGTGGITGSSLWVNTPSLNSNFHSGFGVTGTYGTPAQRSVVNLTAYGVYSSGGYGSDLAFSTTNGVAITEVLRLSSAGAATFSGITRIGLGGTALGKFSVNDGTNINLSIKVGQTDATAVMLNAYNDDASANIPLEFRASKFAFQSGNVGINTTTPVQPLQLGEVSVIAQDVNSMYIGANFGSGTGGNYIKSQFANQIHFDSAVGSINFKVAASGTLGNAISYTTALTIASTGAATFSSTATAPTFTATSTLNASVSVSLSNPGANGVSDGPYFRYLNTTNSYQILKQINANTDEDTWSIRGGSWTKIGTLNAVTGAYTALSDINKKKDFELSTIGLNAILGLKPTLYRMLDEENTDKNLGFIAQEVKEFIPQAYVENGGDDYKFIGLNYNAIVAALVKGMQEQQSQIEALKLLIK
jgi:hypothetical protein